MNRPSFFVNLLVFLTLNILIDTEYVLTSAIPNEMIPTSSLTHTLVRRKFKCEKYVDCQISDGTAGNCLEAAIEVFLTPLGLSLSNDMVISPAQTLKAISKEDFKLLKNVAREASTSEKPGFNVAIENSISQKDLNEKLKAGKTCNKVLKLLGAVTYISIEVAQGKGDRQEKVAEETKKLKKNVGIDINNKGKPMMSFLSTTTPPSSTT